MKYTSILSKILLVLQNILLAPLSYLSVFSEFIFPRPSESAQLEKLPKRVIMGRDHYFSVYFYQDDKVKEIIKYLKHYDDSTFIRNLVRVIYQELKYSEWYKKKISVENYESFFVLAVPTTDESFKKYGKRNHIRKFALEFAATMNLPLLPENATSKTNTKKQALLSRHARLHNLKGAFTVLKPEKIYQKNIIIIDDVWTTGSTLRELSLCLYESGAKNVFAITIAH